MKFQFQRDICAAQTEAVSWWTAGRTRWGVWGYPFSPSAQPSASWPLAIAQAEIENPGVIGAYLLVQVVARATALAARPGQIVT